MIRPQPRLETAMFDLGFLALGLAGFAACLGFLRFCARL